MTASNAFAKDPDAVKDFRINWASWLDTAETIASSTWVVPAGITKDSDTNTTTTATVWLSGGTAGATYSLTNRIVTNQARTEDRVIVITVGPAAIANAYATLPELKARLDIGDTDDDTALEGVLMAASRWIDSKTGTRFYTVAETRIYTACFGHMVEIDNLVSLTSLKTDPAGDGTFATTWAAADYRLAPYNALLNSQPYTWIETRQGGAYSFPPASSYDSIVVNYNYDRPRSPQPLVQVIGLFGYSTAAPPAIKEACILASMRMWGRKDLLYGVSGSAELGTLTAITKLGSDGELMALLSTVKRRAIV